MVAWSNNPDWAKPIEREFCGHVSDAYLPCENLRPCPIHDRAAVGPAADVGAPVSPSSPGAPTDLPMPRLMDGEAA